jgi:hypothetical protein
MSGVQRSSTEKKSWRKDHVSYHKDDGCDCSLHDEDPPNEPSVDSVSSSSDVQSSSADLESNFIKAISLSSLIHPTHDLCLLPVPMRQDTKSSGALLDLAGAQTLLMDACNAFGLSLEAFQHL